MGKPLIGVSACSKVLEGYPQYTVGAKYVDALLGFPCLPVMLPPLGEQVDMEGLLARLDGVVLTGSPSNVHPDFYDGPPVRDAAQVDRDRDNTTLPLIRQCRAEGLPLLAICRGLQEVNVALGGDLAPYLWETEGRFDHRRNERLSFDDQYLPTHEITLSDTGYLAEAFGAGSRHRVNSLHGQGVGRLAPGLRVEALSDDKVIEALSGAPEDGFLLAVQWHPEHPVVREEPLNHGLYDLFEQAMHTRG